MVPILVATHSNLRPSSVRSVIRPHMCNYVSQPTYVNKFDGHFQKEDTPPVADTIYCETHGDCERSLVCSHLTEDVAGLGFNRREPLDDDRFPDAWCDDCDLIYKTHDGWSDEAEALSEVCVLCSGCYELSRIRNTRSN